MVTKVHGFAVRLMICVSQKRGTLSISWSILITRMKWLYNESCKGLSEGVLHKCLSCFIEGALPVGIEKTWTRVFEKNPAYVKRNSNAGRERRECMLRPSFPELYRGDQIPEQFPKSNVIVSVCDTPKVGDLGEWLSEGSYWTAKITKLLSEDMIKVQLLKPPIGEGGCYPAYCKDIRPALDWCLEKGWTVPLSQANGHCWYAARLIHHRSDMENSSSDEEATSDGDEEEVRKSLKRVSDTSQEAPGSSNLETTSDTTATSRLNSQTATIATTVGIPRPSPVSNSLGHSHGAQAAVTSQPGTCSSRRQLGIKATRHVQYHLFRS